VERVAQNLSSQKHLLPYQNKESWRKMKCALFAVPAVFTHEEVILLYRQLIHICFISFIFAILDTIFTRFEALTAALLKIKVFWDVMQCHWVSSYRRFEGA
jgi:hypothetical protein